MYVKLKFLGMRTKSSRAFKHDYLRDCPIYTPLLLKLNLFRDINAIDFAP